MTGCTCDGPDPCQVACDPLLGDLVMLLLAGTLSGLRDRLAVDGYVRHSELVADLVDVVDDYLLHRELGPEARPPEAF